MRVPILAAIMATASITVASDLGKDSTRTEAHHEWDVRPYHGALTLWKDGQPVTPMLFWGSYPMQYEVEGLSREGFELFSFFRSGQHYENPYYKPDGSVALAYQDRQIQNLLSFSPRAFFLPRIFTTAPEWWVEANPGELCQYGSGRTVSSNGRKIPPGNRWRRRSISMRSGEPTGKWSPVARRRLRKATHGDPCGGWSVGRAFLLGRLPLQYGQARRIRCL